MVAVFTFLLPSLSQAYIFVPTASLTIIVNSQGQDNSYHFDLKLKAGMFWEDYNDFDLQTENFTASNTVTLDLWGSNQFQLSEVVPDEWSLTGINCTSDNSGNVFTVSQISPSVIISAVDATNITCVFNNAHTSQKTPVLIVPGVLGTNIL